ncbi:CBS domain-containing protein [Candidatus Pyrohabitans sp.]
MADYREVPDMKVSELMTKYVLMVEPELRVIDAMSRMLEHDFRCLFVARLNPYKELGLVTRFDIMEKVIGRGLDPLKVRVGDIMEKPVFYIDADSTVREAAKIMGENGICNLPVKKEGRVVGVIGSTDIFREYRRRVTG